MIAETINPFFLFLIVISISAIIWSLFSSFNESTLNNRIKTVILGKSPNVKSKTFILARKKQVKKGRTLRFEESKRIRRIVEHLDLRRILVDHKTIDKMTMAGYRNQSHLIYFLFLRFTLPFVSMFLLAMCIFGFGMFGEKSQTFKFMALIFAAYGGFYAPIIFINNRLEKRKKSIRLAYPDALDLMLICVQAGMSIEATFKKVADEMRFQSGALYEEISLTNAELSFLPERRQAYENFGKRTGVAAIKSTSVALIQSDQYGTPIADALRVLCDETREARKIDAEKKAAALPPKLTVPMIVFFLPVLFAVILGPIVIQISGQNFGGQ